MVARGILFRWRTAVRRRFFFAVPSARRLIRPFSNGPPFEQLAALSAKCAGRHFTPGPGAMTISIGDPSTLDRSGAVASYSASWALDNSIVGQGVARSEFVLYRTELSNCSWTKVSAATAYKDRAPRPRRPAGLVDDDGSLVSIVSTYRDDFSPARTLAGLSIPH
jgi:hypothetical protein